MVEEHSAGLLVDCCIVLNKDEEAEAPTNVIGLQDKGSVLDVYVLVAGDHVDVLCSIVDENPLELS